MSTHGGQQPSGWENPYGGTNEWGGEYPPPGYIPGGYAPPGYYAPGYHPPGYPAAPGYAYGPPGNPSAPASTGSATAALVCNIVVAVMLCNVLAIPGIVTSALALGRVRTNPRSARTLTIWSWVLFGASLLIGLIFMILFFGLAASGPAPDPDYSGA